MAQKYMRSNGLRAAGLGLLGGALLWWGLRRRHLKEWMPFNQSGLGDSSSGSGRMAFDREGHREVSSSITETAWANAELPPQSGTNQHWPEYMPSSSDEATDTISENRPSHQEPARDEALANIAGSASSSEMWSSESRPLEQLEDQEAARGEALADIAGSAPSNQTWHTESRLAGQDRGSMPLTEETAQPPAEAKATTPDDLTPIEGIGPKINKVLHDAGINSFAQLAETEISRLEQILNESNPNLNNLTDTSTWPEQARLAAAGDWEGLERLKKELDAGSRRR